MDPTTGSAAFELLQAIVSMPTDGGGEGGGGLLNLILPFGFIIAIMYFLVIRPQNKKQKEHQDLLNRLAKGDKVVTQGGILGRVSGVSEKDGTITLEISDRVRIKVLRSSIVSKQDDGSGEAKDDKK